jgi:elongation of very long chain fatty acids protein 4
MATELVANWWGAWDGICTDAVRTSFAWLGFEELLSPPAKSVAQLPFISSPTVLVSCIAVYLVVVCISLLGNAIRKEDVKRDGVLLRAFVQLHNVFLIGLSLFMCAGILRQAATNGYSFWGNQFRPSETVMAKMIYIFYLSKIYEFLDTVRSLVGCHGTPFPAVQQSPYAQTLWVLLKLNA